MTPKPAIQNHLSHSGVASAPNGSLVRRLDTGVIPDTNPDYDAEFAVTDADQMVEQGYIDRAHNAYRMTDEITVLEPLGGRRHHIDITV